MNISGKYVNVNTDGHEHTKKISTTKAEKAFLDNKKIFIVHGHDEVSKYKLKDYLQNTLHYPEPVILSEVASCGRTIIESFEEETENAGLVFVLLTPDDFMSDTSMRARQNVIFELGYFIGRFGRKSGRVIVLLKGIVDIPSDLSGILYIHIDNGIQEAGEEIRKAINAIK
ncbi:MAG: nucleotide-binding protein [Lachnospiraceae bacterium]|nr:nucleotide-binding protein [Lachnospiraceae bacterium]